jgi:lysophospholipase L1-like esterase
MAVQAPVKITARANVKTAQIRSLTTSAPDMDRLATHKAILEAHGITSLTNVGKLPLGGPITPEPGMRKGVGAGKINFADWFWDLATTVSLDEKLTKGGATGTGLTKGGKDALYSAELSPADGGKSGTSVSQVTTKEAARPSVQQVRIEKAQRIAAPATGRQPGALQAFSGMAYRIPAEPLIGANSFGGTGAGRSGTSIPVNTAYWVGDTIEFANDTQIILDENVRFLVIIATKIIVGTNVSLTYKEKTASPPSPPPKAATGDGGAFPGGTGCEGAAGDPGLPIGTPPAAPEVEIWTLELNRLPSIYLKGQQGFTGGRGGDGGDGGRGADGAPSQHDGFGPSYARVYVCTAGPGSGAPGGQGGRGGNGGPGGTGGMGGRFSLYAPGPVILAATGQGFYISVDGGLPGAGGESGVGGNGGAGGAVGAYVEGCKAVNFPDRVAGATGQQGTVGSTGPMGQPGVPIGPDAEYMVAIDAAQFHQTLTQPAITHIVPAANNAVGDPITITGMRFTPTDKVMVGPVLVTPSSTPTGTEIKCTVPNIAGGRIRVRVMRADGVMSNSCALWVRPVVTGTQPSGRLRPGTSIVVKGSGFNSGSSVRIDNVALSGVEFLDSQTLRVTLRRPTSVAATGPNGDPAVLTVGLSDLSAVSNPLPIVIGTYRMLVLGDSIAWGEGLGDAYKFHSRVEQHIRSNSFGAVVYKTVKAHTGAILGLQTLGTSAAMHGDLPEPLPTVSTQAYTAANELGTDVANIDLILVAASANDVGFKNFVNPSVSTQSIQTRIDQYCRDDMKSFLITLANTFQNARIIVTGYFQGISDDTDPAYVTNLAGLMIARGDAIGLIPAATALLMGPSAAAAALLIDPTKKPDIALRTGYFATNANIALAAAVSQANAATSGATRIFFADPQFGPTNAANASNPWVFGLTTPTVLDPPDEASVAAAREVQCNIKYSGTDKLYCKLASVGHPNETGAQKYFDAIKPHL